MTLRLAREKSDINRRCTYDSARSLRSRSRTRRGRFIQHDALDVVADVAGRKRR
jgi:hypothetical protein